MGATNRKAPHPSGDGNSWRDPRRPPSSLPRYSIPRDFSEKFNIPYQAFPMGHRSADSANEVVRKRTMQIIQLPGDTIEWEGKIFRHGPFRKRWDQHQWPRACPMSFPWAVHWTSCGECDRCSHHSTGCVLTRNFAVYNWSDQMRPESAYDYWLIAPGCQRFHGDGTK